MGGPGWAEVVILPGLPPDTGSGLLVTSLSGLGGGKNVGGNGGAKALKVLSACEIGLFHSAAVFENVEGWDLVELYNCENRLKNILSLKE